MPTSRSPTTPLPAAFHLVLFCTWMWETLALGSGNVFVHPPSITKRPPSPLRSSPPPSGLCSVDRQFTPPSPFSSLLFLRAHPVRTSILTPHRGPAVDIILALRPRYLRWGVGCPLDLCSTFRLPDRQLAYARSRCTWVSHEDEHNDAGSEHSTGFRTSLW